MAARRAAQSHGLRVMTKRHLTAPCGLRQERQVRSATRGADFWKLSAAPGAGQVVGGRAALGARQEVRPVLPADHS
jgi:hypothetical protein